MPRTGVFICWCGANIAKTVEVKKAALAALDFPGVVFAADYQYMCSEPGQKLILDAIKQHNLERVVVGSCSPALHELTFQNCIAGAGLNPYFFEMANLREQCSWVHSDKETATQKAIDSLRMATARLQRAKPLTAQELPISKRALVIGGGISGIEAALTIAEAGFPVTLVEKEPSIGGRMAQLDKTFPTMDCSACILTPKMVEAARHPKITLLTYARVEEVSGFVGNFTVKIRKKARSVDLKLCTGCGLCIEKCPVKVPSEFEEGLAQRKAIYTPFPQAVPNVPVIERESCLYFSKGKCGVCAKICPTGAIDYQQEDRLIEEKVGAIVVATGFDTFDPLVYEEYAGGENPDIITAMQFERMVNASGPTGGKLVCPSNQREPETVVFITCIGCRDENKGFPYCARICCMFTAKHAILAREKLPKARILVFYTDERFPGKNFEEFGRRAKEEYRAEYIRGRVAKIYPSQGRLELAASDTIMGRQLQLNADLVVLATGSVAGKDAKELARKLGVQLDQYNFFSEAHPKLKPVETMTAGIYLAGGCQFPRDIPDCVQSGAAAAAKVCALFGREKLLSLPTVAWVKEELCTGCLSCLSVCPYKAIEEAELKTAGGELKKAVRVNPAVCQGCGVCAGACYSGAIDLLGFSNFEILEEIDSAFP